MPISHALPTPAHSPARLLGRPWLDAPPRSTLRAMAPTAEQADPGAAALAAEEARLAQAAAGGDGDAFAALYQRYERRAYNLAYRITASEDDAADAVQEAFLSVMRRLPRLQDRELAFGSYLFTAARNACYDLMERRRRAEPSDSIPDSAAPIGAGAGGLGLDPGDPDEDPDRRLLLESQQEEIRTANARLPERQREALALRELEEMSYDDIAAVMDMNRNSVAQLISRARISLRDELRGTALASIAASSPDCERALPLIAMRDDRQLAHDSPDAAWLDAHMAGCDTCRLSLEAMQEAGTSYRAWSPIAAAPWLFEQTMARAAELTGSDWSAAIADRPTPTAIQPGMPPAYLAGLPPTPAGAADRKRRRTIAAALAAAILLLAIAATVLGDGDPSPPPPPADTVEPRTTTQPQSQQRAQRRPRRARRDRTPPIADATEPVPTDGTSTADDSTPATPRPRPRPHRNPSSPPIDLVPDPTVEPPVTEEPPPDEPVEQPPPPEPPEPPREPPTPPTGPTGPTGPPPPPPIP
jgi:RNA polymerase sigma factor (sigma-70 family)